MTALLVFLLVGCGLAQSTILTKCQLKKQLNETIQNLENNYLGDSEETEAKIVCYVELTSGFNTSSVKEKKVDNSIWKLYGIFQLSDHLICSDGQTPSLNKCGKICTDLLDSNISDDIDCLLETLNDLMAKMIFLHPECIEKEPSEYFSDCR